jgi:cytochrome c biogenesis factor
MKTSLLEPWLKTLLVVVVALVVLAALATACPLCKDALEDQANNGEVPNQVGRGFYYSILLMVSAPFALVGGVFFQIRRTRRRATGAGA